MALSNRPCRAWFRGPIEGGGTEAGSYVRLIHSVSLNLRLKDLLGPLTRVKKKKTKHAHLATRWSTTLSSKVNLSHAINFRALSGVNLAMSHARIWGQQDLRTPPCGYHQPSKWEQIPVVDHPGWYHMSLDSGDLQYNSRGGGTAFCFHSEGWC